MPKNVFKMDFYDEDSMVPERDASHAGFHPGDDLLGDNQSTMLMKTSVAAFNQQR